MNKSKKILFIADEIPQSIHAGSIQFLRIFKDYPPENLMVFGKSPEKKATLLACRYEVIKFSFNERLRVSRFATLLSNLQSIGLFLTRLSSDHTKLADEFNPDLVVTLMQHITYYYPAFHYAKTRKKPLVVYCHDDAEDFSRVSLSLRSRLVLLNAKIYKYATKRICISPEMALAWEKKYHVKGDYMYPISSLELQRRPHEITKILVDGSTLTIGYAGSLVYGYKEGILELLPFLEQHKVKLRIYRDEDISMPKSRFLSWAGFASTAEETWEKIKAECDAVILPYSFNPHYEVLYSTHFPSKLAEYSALGMPVVIHGPMYATGVKFGLQNKNSYSVATNDVGLQGEIKKLGNPECRLRLVENIENAWCKHFSAINNHFDI